MMWQGASFIVGILTPNWGPATGWLCYSIHQCSIVCCNGVGSLRICWSVFFAKGQVLSVLLAPWPGVSLQNPPMVRGSSDLVDFHKRQWVVHVLCPHSARDHLLCFFLSTEEPQILSETFLTSPQLKKPLAPKLRGDSFCFRYIRLVPAEWGSIPFKEVSSVCKTHRWRSLACQCRAFAWEKKGEHVDNLGSMTAFAS